MRPRLTYANVMSTVAVVVALGGTSYAAIGLPNNSITSKKIKDGAVHTGDLANGAVSSKKVGNNAITNSKLANNAVTSSKLANNTVSTSKIASAAVTSPKLAPSSISESNIVSGSLTGAAFKCQTGDEGLDNRNTCFFKIHTSGVTWLQAVALCRARGSTPSTLASPAEVAAAAPLGGSPFRLDTLWTSAVGNGLTSGTVGVAQAIAAEVDSNGTVVAFIQEPVNQAVIGDVACVYHAADVF